MSGSADSNLWVHSLAYVDGADGFSAQAVNSIAARINRYFIGPPPYLISVMFSIS